VKQGLKWVFSQAGEKWAWGMNVEILGCKLILIWVRRKERAISSSI